MIKKLLAVLCFVGASSAFAQQNNSSPYSFYGVGDTKFKGTAENRSMGSIGVLTEKYTDQYHNRILKEICTLVGINKNVTFHVARHTFATNYLRLGGKVEVLQKILGHSKITQTMVYVHIVQQELDRGMEIMDNLISETHFAQLYHSIVGSDELSQAV